MAVPPAPDPPPNVPSNLIGLQAASAIWITSLLSCYLLRRLLLWLREALSLRTRCVLWKLLFERERWPPDLLDPERFVELLDPIVPRGPVLPTS